jgi:maltose O-acetyltransferase
MNRSIRKFIFLGIKFMEKHYLRLMDEIYTQWFASRFAHCGPNLRLHYPCVITGPEYVDVGENVHINRNALFRAEGSLKIVNNVHIARNLVIYTINHNYLGNALPYDATMIKKPVIIERNVWIGINVTIVPGVTIGEGAIVGAGTTVSQDIPPLALVGSQPLRILKYRPKYHYEALDKEKRYGGPGGRPYTPD